MTFYFKAGTLDIMKIKRRRLLEFFLAFVALILLCLFFSHRLLEVPSGLTVDEAAFGYNAALISETGSDQNGRFLPVFVLSIDGKDWRQPVTQYYITAFFKLFGPSVFNLRFTSITITLISTVLLFVLAKKLLDFKWALFTLFIFLTTPLIMIQSHMALDNIMPIPFTIIWLWGVCSFTRTKKRRYLIIAALSLGINFYTYKGMRAAVPIWVLVTISYLLIYHYKNQWVQAFKQSFKDILVFLLSILPFFAIIPLLELKYSGAVFDRHTLSFNSIYSLLYPYFSSFDPSFMYIIGDLTKYHSTGQHGMMLLASSPLFFAGLYYAVRNKGFWAFILICFFTAPLLFGMVGSVHRASRLMMLIPIYSLIATLGAKSLWDNKPKIYYKSSLVVIILLMLINYADFINYYWYAYPQFTKDVFGDLRTYLTYERFAQEAQAKNLTPYIDQGLYNGGGESGHFYEAIYFKTPVTKITDDKIPPPKSILMTHRINIPEMKELPVKLEFRLQIRE